MNNEELARAEEVIELAQAQICAEDESSYGGAKDLAFDVAPALLAEVKLLRENIAELLKA